MTPAAGEAADARVPRRRVAAGCAVDLGADVPADHQPDEARPVSRFAVGSVATTWPSFITVTRSVIWNTSPRRCEM